MPFVSQTELEHLAGRIQQAYLRRGARWNDGCSTPRVWAAAAKALWACRLEDARTPIDPELYVASQEIDPDAPNPWIDLVSGQAVERYRRRIRSIVRQLRSELDREIRLAERLISRGRPTVDVLDERNPRLSPLSRYIVARRALRDDLAERWSSEALAQHRSCPLYRDASVDFLSLDEYPRDREAPAPPPLSTIYSQN